MGYISYENIIRSREWVSSNVSKPDTFAGLILFLFSVEFSQYNGKYLKANMKHFSKYADEAFYLKSDIANYTDKFWYALLSNDWLLKVTIHFLKEQKISALNFAITLFWQRPFDSNQDIVGELRNKLSSDVFDSFFIDDSAQSNLFTEDTACNKNTFLTKAGGTSDAPTIKYDGSFIKKRASDLSAAPFSQTLYAANEIKEIISVFHFDFISNFDLIGLKTLGNKTDNARLFYDWLINTGLSENTANSYAYKAIDRANKILNSQNFIIKDLYQSNYKAVSQADQFLSNNTEWQDADRTGNRNYSAALKKYLEYLKVQKKYLPLPKAFILLAGISGTGKTRFVREQAKLTGSLIETYQLVSVRPDWHEPSDLFGYVSRLGSKPQYIATDFLKFIVNCWKAIEKAGISLSGGVATGNAIAIQQLAPYWLCLDEMNLAPVEQYFADYLSVLETREWSWEDDSFTYTSAPLLKSLAFDGVDDSAMRQVLGLESTEDDALWLEIKLNGIGLPFNLIVAGTVNMDETTHGFSRKVLDRALAIDFGEFFPNDYAAYFVPTTKNLPLTYPTLSDGRNLEALANTIDLDGAKSIAFLNSINTVLAGTPFALAYRALNELLLAVICAKPSDEKHLQAVWDDFLMCKVLPRIEGDAEKLLVYQDANATHVLSGLNQALEGLLSDIWDDKNRPDLFRKNVSDTDLMVECRSRKKIAWMMNRLERTSFTSFWP